MRTKKTVKQQAAARTPPTPLRRSGRISKQVASPPKPEPPAKTKPMSTTKGRPRKRKAEVLEPEPEPEPETVPAPAESEVLPIDQDEAPQEVEDEETEEAPEPPRLKKFRPKCPQTVEMRMARVRMQRMYCLGRERDEKKLKEVFTVAGSTGNLYTVTLKNVPTCNCPDGKKNGTCKHILFVMLKVVRARYALTYQMALLNSEIKEIFEKSPIPLDTDGGLISEKRKRKPLDQDECPICYEPFEESDSKILFCAAQCGSNIHGECFRQWAASRGGAQVTCVMCRTLWENIPANEGDYGKIVKEAQVGSEGFRNVGAEMGLSSYRDTSTYHHFYGYGYKRRRWW
ncbi:hypothetical protein TWF694_010886 [Orbilia ellipsospora]|uniref:Uncharacterized protein n=1 Tax=Orbilia ellipsospora TaxID=2528407 RepID=A0AAV9XDK8_9PEZI